MQRYNGSDPGDERPIGGGEYNSRGRGSELHNFHSIAGTIYGYFQVPRRDLNGYGILSLERIHPGANGDSLNNVTVIFVAPEIERRDPTAPWLIVGWYRSATVLRVARDDTTGQRLTVDTDGNEEGALYNVMVEAENAVLLPPFRRTFAVPRGKGGMGQANVRYLYDERGKFVLLNWMIDAIAYVQEYDGENWLTDQLAELAHNAAQELERAAGYESNPQVRKAVERYSMEVVETYYRRLGYSVEDTSKTKSYDFLCKKGGTELRVEVKGTRTDGKAVLFTKAEVALAKDRNIVVDLCVVHSIRLQEREPLAAEGGMLVRYLNWNPADHGLTPLQYECRLNKESAALD
jgi:hypothetical protein